MENEKRDWFKPATELEMARARKFGFRLEGRDGDTRSIVYSYDGKIYVDQIEQAPNENSNNRPK